MLVLLYYVVMRTVYGVAFMVLACMETIVRGLHKVTGGPAKDRRRQY